MATPWPLTLPQCPTLYFSEQRQRNVVAFQPDVGIAKMRRRSTAVGVSTSMTFRLTTAQLATFDTFYETTLSDGSLPFDMAHPVTKVNWSWVFDSKDAPKKDRISPGYHMVSFTLMRLPT
jgi:hypothetical protein